MESKSNNLPENFCTYSKNAYDQKNFAHIFSKRCLWTTRMQYRYPWGKVSLKVRRFLYQISKTKIIVLFLVCTFYPKCIREFAESNHGKTAVNFQPDVGNQFVSKQFSLENYFFPLCFAVLIKSNFVNTVGFFPQRWYFFGWKFWKLHSVSFLQKTFCFQKLPLDKTKVVLSTFPNYCSWNPVRSLKIEVFCPFLQNVSLIT